MSAKYTPNSQGMSEFMNSSMVGRAMGSIAADMAAQANREGKGRYESAERTVTGGWNATARAGAEVVETERAWGDVHRRTLLNISNQYVMRGGG